MAVAENTKGRCKSTAGRKLIAAALAFASPLAFAAPIGGQVSAGAGTIAQAGTTTTITQSTQNLAINWQSFGVAANEAVNFAQPNASAIALNRVLGQNPSSILGSLSANGQVFILNPNGILFGAGSQVNVGGLVASTLNLSDADFIAGTHTFSSPLPQAGEGLGVRGTVVNQGTLSAAQNGYIALLAPEVRNDGVISATLGTALLAAGDKVTLNLNNGSLLSYSIDQGSLNALADNKQLIQADGGQVYMSAKAANALSTAVVNNTGIIEARTIQNINGTIKLMGDMQVGTVNVGGTLDASVLLPSPAGGGGLGWGSDGGFIETSAAHVNIANDAKVTTLTPNGNSGTWLIDPVDFTIAATGGDITGATLSTNLGAGNVIIQSTTGAAGTAGDVNVNDVVTWSANKLTLNAQNNININANMNGSGTASLALEYGQGAVALNNTSNIITTGAAVSLPAGTTNFTTLQGSDGVVKNYTVITSLGAASSVTATDLQGMNGNLAGNYALGSNIDATATSGWNACATCNAGGAGFYGFAPVGDNSTFGASSRFTGTFDGLGHTISNLTINRPTTDYVGLFGYTATGSTIKNVGLVGGSVSGQQSVGGLVGYNPSGTVSNSYNTGSVSGTAFVGGLVGYNNTGATVSNSYATGIVTGVGGNSSYMGGLVGYNLSSTISYSYATGHVSAGSSQVGGLVGGNSSSTISNSYATGNVVNTGGSINAGGLSGDNMGGGTIINSFATGTVSSFGADVGGLVGDNWGSISNSYATGSVNSTSQGVGGLAGRNIGTITDSYATGSVSGSGLVGGFVGELWAGTVSNSYWNSSVNTIGIGGGGTGTMIGGGGLTAAQLQQSSNFTTWDLANTWIVYNGFSNPLLRTFMTPLTVTANSPTKTYDGLAYYGVNGVTYSSTPNANLLGTVSYVDTSQGAINAGSYAITPSGLYSTLQIGGYAISFVSGALTVNPAPLTAIITAPNKVYDGTTTASPTFSITAGLIGTETVTATGTATFNSKDVLTANLVTANSNTLADGSNGGLASNYSLVTGQTVVASITAPNKTYNGTTTATPTFSITAGLIGTETVTATGTATFNSKDVLSANLVTANSNTLADGTNGGLASNYSLTTGQTVAANITAAALTASITAPNKTYSGTTTASPTFSITAGLIGTETVTASGTATFNSKDVSSANLVTANSNTLADGANGGLASNYSLATGQTVAASITPAALSATVAAPNKVYDANTTAAPTLTITAGLVGTETVTATGTATFNSKDVLTANLVTANSNTLADGTNGGLASNYSLATGQTVAASITPKELTITASGVNKVYNGLTSATVNFADNRIANDILVIGGTATFANKNVGIGKAVSVSGINVTGTDADNYSFNTTASTTADITARALVVSATGVNKVYDGRPGVTVSYTDNRVAGDRFIIFSTATFADSSVGLAKTVSVSNIKTIGTDAGNYTVPDSTTTTADITPRPTILTQYNAQRRAVLLRNWQRRR